MEATLKNMIEVVESLSEKAREAEDSGDAMRFSQAAANMANAYAALQHTKSLSNDALRESIT